MSPAELAAVALGVFAFALVSRRAEAEFLTAPMTFAVLGLVAGPAGLGLVELPVGHAFVDGLAGLTLGLVLFTDAARINVSRLGREHTLPLRMLGLGLPLTIFAGILAALALLPGLSLGEAALLAVILAPTDAALGQAMVMNPRVPVRIRQALNVESGLNDGLVFPFLLIAASLATAPGAIAPTLSPDVATIAGNLLLGPLAGAVVGGLGAEVLERMNTRAWVTPVFLRLAVVALAVLAYAGAEAMHGNGFLAAFVAGLLTGARAPAVRRALEDFGEAEGQLLSLLVFLLFGALMLPRAVEALEWRHVAYGLLSLTVVRMVPVALSLSGLRLRPRTLLFLGWFGPRGLASILYLLLIEESFSIAPHDDIAATVGVTVFLSILAHGITAAPLARHYGRRMETARQRGQAAPEHASCHAFSLRWKGQRD